MLTKPNFQRLLQVIDATEEFEAQPDHMFRLSLIFDDKYSPGCDNVCGTAACCIGAYNWKYGRFKLTFGIDTTQEYDLAGNAYGWSPDTYERETGNSAYHKDCDHFEITKAEYDWLFCECGVVGKWFTEPRDLSEVSMDQALQRVRKFIYYKMHKQEMILDSKGRVNQHCPEGDHNFVNHASKAGAVPV